MAELPQDSADAHVPTSPLSSPGSTLERHNRHRAQEMEGRFIRALKELRFKEALRLAESITALDPGNARVKEFIPVLNEKIALDEEDEDEDDDSDDDDAEEGATEQGGDAHDSPEDEQDATTSAETTESDEEPEEAKEREGKDLVPAPDLIPAGGTHSGQRRRWGEGAVDDQSARTQPHVTRIALDNRSAQLTAEQRRRIRADLARSIAGLKAQADVEALVLSDPLLGAGDGAATAGAGGV